ncbi:hypothetical protein L195_g061003 [Trifolium pratense]|uniref:Uncharacterized protein n=1 Tax=Trifolium pratense TaxID=57577 RepID=A0A2K3K764_TRIPR|nr:hypothetical protein L195_g061003 [Trifolium pratense]
MWAAACRTGLAVHGGEMSHRKGVCEKGIAPEEGGQTGSLRWRRNCTKENSKTFFLLLTETEEQN